ncbi:MAG TPA: hypothetical protein VGU74_12235 [Gemmatimonadales bacterium]|nr:hypothetical protein [Gemmatimonadales bacterium]
MNAWVNLSVASWVVVAAQLQAQTQGAPNHLYDRYQFTVSGTQVWLGSNVRVDRSDGTPGTEFTPEDVGAATHSWEPRLAVRWRPGGGRRHELELGYLFVRSSGSRALADTIRFADTSFAKGLRVNSALKSDQASLTYRYAFHAAERSQIGLAVGLGALFVNLDLDAVAGATSGGADTAIVPFSVSRGTTGPLGSLGFYGRWLVGDRWSVESDARGLYAKVDRIGATVFEAGAAGRYFVSRRAGFELGYGLTWIKLTLDRRSSGKGLAGLLKYSLQNARLAVVLTP